MTYNHIQSKLISLSRISLGLLFLYFGILAVYNPGAQLGWLADWVLRIPFVGTSSFIFLIGIVEIIVGVGLVLGIFTRISAYVATALLVSISINLGFTEIAYRDLALACAALVVAVSPVVYALDNQLKRLRYAVLLLLTILFVLGAIFWAPNSMDSTHQQTDMAPAQLAVVNDTVTNVSVEQTPTETEVDQPVVQEPITIPEPVVQAPVNDPEPIAQEPGITLEEVALHADKTDCWTAINGEVYDLTSYVMKHPGGSSRIARICGIDGTEQYEQQHGGERRPLQILETLFMAPLKQGNLVG